MYELFDMGDLLMVLLLFEMECCLGDCVMCQICCDLDFVFDLLIIDYFNGIGYKLIEVVCCQYVVGSMLVLSFELFVVWDFGINVFVLLGGYIGVNMGMLVVIESELELVLVFGYEIGYVLQWYIVCGIDKFGELMWIVLVLILLVGFVVIKSGDVVQVLVMGGQVVVVLNQFVFLCGVECEVDCVGFMLFMGVGYNFDGMLDFF